MSRILDAVRAKYPQYATVPDDKLITALGGKYQTYLDQDEDFRREFHALQPSMQPVTEAPAATPAPATPPGVLTQDMRGKPFAPDLGLSPFREAALARQQAAVSGVKFAQQQRDAARQMAGDDPGKLAAIDQDYIAQLDQMGVTVPVEKTPIEQATTPIVSLREAIPDLPPIWTDRLGTGGKVTLGVAKGLASTVDFFLSPLGIATLGIGGLSAPAQRVIAGTFAVDMARHTPEIGRQIGEAFGRGDIEAATELTTHGLLTSVFTAKTAQHAIGKTRGELSRTLAREIDKRLEQPDVKEWIAKIERDQRDPLTAPAGPAAARPGYMAQDFRPTDVAPIPPGTEISPPAPTPIPRGEPPVGQQPSPGPVQVGEVRRPGPDEPAPPAPVPIEPGPKPPAPPAPASAVAKPPDAAQTGPAPETITGSNERTGSEMPAEGRPVPPVAPPGASPPAKPTRRRQAQERPWDIIDEIEASVGKIRGKKASRPGEEGYYGEAYNDIAKSSARRLLTQSGGQSWDSAADTLRRSGWLPESASVDDLQAAIIGAREGRKGYRKQLASEKKVVQHELAVEKDWQQHGLKPGEGKDPISVSELLEGDVLEVDGTKFTVKELVWDPETTDLAYVVLEDGRRFGVRTVAGDAVIHPDTGTFKSEGPSTDFVPEGELEKPAPAPAAEPFILEGVGRDQVRAEEAAQAQAKAQQTATDDLAARAAAPLVGDSSDVGQAKLFKEDVDLFSGPAAERPGGGGGGGSAVGFPAPAPAAPAVQPTPAPPVPPGITMIQHGRLPVTLPRSGPGSIGVPEILRALEDVQRAAGSDAGNIRVGRFAQKALGIFKSWSEIIRTKDIDNLPTATHEVGHALQKQLFGSVMSKGLRSLPAGIRRELIGLGKALYGSRKPVAGYSGEGFAEFMRHWLTTDNARTVAPQTFAFFERTVLPKYPEVAKSLAAARSKIDIWRRQGAEERAQRQLVRQPGAWKRVWDALKHFVHYQGQMESFAPLQALSKAAEKNLGRPLRPSEDPFLVASAKRGSAGALIERMATKNMVDVWGNPSGPPLAEALSIVQGKRREFGLYLFARRAIERWSHGKNPGISLEDAQHIRTMFDTPKFQLAAQKYYEWWDGVLNYAVQADPTMSPLVAAIKAGSADYVPLARMIDPAKARSSAASSASNPMMRMFGSGLPVKDIFDQTFVSAARILNQAHRAMVTNRIFRLSRIEGLGHMVEEVPRSKVLERVNIEKLREQLESMGVDTTGIPPDTLLEYFNIAEAPKGSDPIVQWGTGADARWFHVDPKLYDSLTNLQNYDLRSIPTLGPIIDVLAGVPARAFRLGTTGLRPTFSLLTNPIRDVRTLLMQTSVKNPAKAAASWPVAMAEVIRAGLGGKESPMVAAFHNLAVNMAQPLGIDIGHTKRVSNELFHGRFLRVVKNPVDHARQLLGLPEAAPRIAEMKAVANEIGWTPGTPMTPDQAIQLSMAGRRVTTDFAAAGDISRVLNAAVPFYNPAVQGLRTFGRTFRNHPARSTLLGLGALTVPTLLNWWRNKDKEWYQALPWREKYLYDNVDDGVNVWQIPRPFEWGNLFQVMPEALFDSWYRQDPEGVKQALWHVFETTNPADYPVLAKMAKEQWQNRIEFWDRPIVPRSEIDLPASQQVGPYTTRLAKAMGRAFPSVSPRRIDAAVRGYFGSAVPDMLDFIGLGASAQERERELSDLPVFGKLIRRGGQFNAQNQQIADFFDQYLTLRAKVNGARKQMAAEAQGKPTGPPIALDAMDTGKLKDAEKRAEAIRALTDMATTTKERKAREELYREAGQLAAEGVDVMKLKEQP